MTAPKLTVSASEYDALIDVICALVEAAWMGDYEEAARDALLDCGDDEVRWLRRIGAGERAAELFARPDRKAGS